MKARAFTAIELLVVFSMIGILAMIAVPNFLESQMRGKHARATMDMHSVQQALHAYQADYQAYPPNHPAARAYWEWMQAQDPGAGTTVPAERMSNPGIMEAETPEDSEISYRRKADDVRPLDRTVVRIHADGSVDRGADFPVLLLNSWQQSLLTTPVAYLRGPVPADVFHDMRAVAPYMYINLRDIPGRDAEAPDPFGGYARFLLYSPGPDADSSAPTWNNPLRMEPVVYDATNGTVSHGDFILTGR